nr:2415_t:CDS:2 [Entrophospora candida]
MKFTKKHDEMLKQVPWILIKAKNIKTDDLIEDKEQKVADDIVVLLVKSVFTKNSYIILFTDLKNVWFEELFSDEIKQRFQETSTTTNNSEKIEPEKIISSNSKSNINNINEDGSNDNDNDGKEKHITNEIDKRQQLKELILKKCEHNTKKRKKIH